MTDYSHIGGRRLEERATTQVTAHRKPLWHVIQRPNHTEANTDAEAVFSYGAAVPCDAELSIGLEYIASALPALRITIENMRTAIAV